MGNTGEGQCCVGDYERTEKEQEQVNKAERNVLWMEIAETLLLEQQGVLTRSAGSAAASGVLIGAGADEAGA